MFCNKQNNEVMVLKLKNFSYLCALLASLVAGEQSTEIMLNPLIYFEKLWKK
jgi:hypothetical protein